MHDPEQGTPNKGCMINSSTCCINGSTCCIKEKKIAPYKSQRGFPIFGRNIGRVGNDWKPLSCLESGLTIFRESETGKITQAHPIIHTELTTKESIREKDVMEPCEHVSRVCQEPTRHRQLFWAVSILLRPLQRDGTNVNPQKETQK
jgi:hypothetical protein